jgi:hypothetical protein
MNKLKFNKLVGNRKSFKFNSLVAGDVLGIVVMLYFFQVTYVTNVKKGNKFKRKFKRHFKNFRLFLKYSVFRFPLYYEYFSRDCDMFETGGVGKTRGYFNFLKNREEFFLFSEYSGYYNIIDKSEYLERKNYMYQRDRVMEAYENGNGNSLFV